MQRSVMGYEDRHYPQIQDLIHSCHGPHLLIHSDAVAVADHLNRTSVGIAAFVVAVVEEVEIVAAAADTSVEDLADFVE